MQVIGLPHLPAALPPGESALYVVNRRIGGSLILYEFLREQKREKTLKKTRIKLCNTLALPVLLYGSETWTVKASDARRITAAEMKYMRRTAGYTLDRLQNKCTNCKGVKN